MKNLIKILTLSILLYFVAIISMEQEDNSIKEPYSEEIELDLVGGLPNELWESILLSVYLGPLNLNENCKDIYEALGCIKKRFYLHTKNICLTCKAFNSLFLLKKNELKKIFKSLLTEKYLEFRDEGFYPKGDNWLMEYPMDKEIARFFLSTNKDSTNIFVSIYFQNKPSILSVLLFYYELNIDEISADCPILHRIFGPLDEKGKKIFKLLLAHGASINIKDSEGDTLLHSCLKHSADRETVEFLLSNNADVNLKSLEGNTALHFAIMSHRFDNDMSEIIMMLLNHNADINIANNKAKTPRVLAKAKGINLEALRNSSDSSENLEKSENAFRAGVKNCTLI